MSPTDARQTTAFEPPPGVCDAFRTTRRPIVATHVYPDGDAIGSQLALARALRRRGAKPRIFVAHPAPLLQEFLDPRGEVEVVLGGRFSADQKTAIAEADCVFVVDTSDPRRLGDLEPAIFAAQAPKVLIDHHLADDLSAFDEAWCVPSCPATGLLVERLLRAEGVEFDRDLAEPLFVALAMDTGWFRFSNSSAAAFETAARLVAAGADPSYLHQALYENSSLGRTQALGQMLSALETDSSGRIIWSVVRQEELENYGITIEDVDGFIDSLKAVRGAEILILFVEVSSGSYKVSLRSKGETDVHRIAVEFGGGGHAKAAGFRISHADESHLQDSAGSAASTRDPSRRREPLGVEDPSGPRPSREFAPSTAREQSVVERVLEVADSILSRPERSE